MRELDELMIRQQVLFELLQEADVCMDNNGQGVMISFKEIYDEVKKTSNQIDGISKRLESVEKKIEKQEDEQRQNRYKLNLALLVAAIPFVAAIIIFAAKGGAF
jgi:predicted DNA-binding protein YlxM (UPF0122 family)